VLKALYIENIVLIKKAHLIFENGMTSITGDSGSGKSVILDSINIIVGDRASQNVIRNGENKAMIYAEFDISQNTKLLDKLNEFGYNSNGNLIIKKIINRESGSKIFINDIPSSVNFIKNLTQDLIEIHGQMQQLNILNPSLHITILDKYIQSNDDFEKLSNAYFKYKETLKEFENIKCNLQKAEIEINELEEMDAELSKYDIQENEEMELINSRYEYLKANKVSEFILNIITKIDSINTGSVLNSFSKFTYQDEENKSKEIDINKQILKAEEFIDNANINIASARDILNNIVENFNANCNIDIDKLENRIDKIRDLSRKYRVPSGSFFIFVQNIQNKINETHSMRKDFGVLKLQLEKFKNEYLEYAKIIHEKRCKGGIEIANFVNIMLKNLEMKDAVFEVLVKINDDKISQIGSDDVRFVASLNLGSKKLPIDEIASGGEISRLILALKSAIATKFSDDGVIIFDEIEAGLSSNIAIKVAQELHKMSKFLQIIAITHSPYIAGIANNHFKVEKFNDESSTTTSIEKLSYKERVIEVAKMISNDGNQQAQDISIKILNKHFVNL